MMEHKSRVRSAANYLTGLAQVIKALPLEPIARLIADIEQAQLNDRQIFVMGNGGSAATASHMACDLAKNTFDRSAGLRASHLRVVSLTDNVAWISALGNDEGYDQIFADQLRALLRPGDLVIAVTGSGNSPNILEGVRVARALGARVVGMLGFDGGLVREMLDDYVLVPSGNYGYIEDVHLMLNHILVSHMRDVLKGEPIASALEVPMLSAAASQVAE